MVPLANSLQFYHLCTESNTIHSTTSPAGLRLQAQENTKLCHPSLTQSICPSAENICIPTPIHQPAEPLFILFHKVVPIPPPTARI